MSTASDGPSVGRDPAMMVDVDLHTHSRFFHGFPGRPTPYDEVGFRLHVAVAQARGLDAMAVTNHDYCTEFDIDTGDLTIIPGIEVSSTVGHLLVVGPDPPAQTKPNMMTPAEVIDLAHDHGCVVVLPHPFRNSRVRETDAAVDAVEINGKHPKPTSLVEDLAAERDLPIVGGSDAHYPIEVGRAFTRMDVESLTPAGVADAIREGRTDYRIVRRFPDQYLTRLYGLVHRLKGHTKGVAKKVTPEDGAPVVGSRSGEPREESDAPKGS